jgi:hypothetical protein
LLPRAATPLQPPETPCFPEPYQGRNMQDRKRLGKTLMAFFVRPCSIGLNIAGLVPSSADTALSIEIVMQR